MSRKSLFLNFRARPGGSFRTLGRSFRDLGEIAGLSGTLEPQYLIIFCVFEGHFSVGTHFHSKHRMPRKHCYLWQLVAKHALPKFANIVFFGFCLRKPVVFNFLTPWCLGKQFWGDPQHHRGPPGAQKRSQGPTLSRLMPKRIPPAGHLANRRPNRGGHSTTEAATTTAVASAPL